MAMLVLIPALVLLLVVLFAPLMLPGAIVVFVVLGIVALVQRHHARRTLSSH